METRCDNIPNKKLKIDNVGYHWLGSFAVILEDDKWACMFCIEMIERQQSAVRQHFLNKHCCFMSKTLTERREIVANGIRQAIAARIQLQIENPGSNLVYRFLIKEPMPMMMNFAVLTVSDRCSREENKDQSGPLLKQLIESMNNCDYLFKVSRYEIIPDDQELIKSKLIEFSNQAEIKCIITTGGTGLANRDVTPDATAAVIEKEVPGIAIALISSSCKITPMAMLSRLKCGILNKTLIINFPGSTKSCNECFKVIKPILKHAIDLLNESTETVNVLHQQMHQQAKSNNQIVQKSEQQPADNRLLPLKIRAKTVLVSERPRQSKFEMIPITEAYKKIFAEIADHFIRAPAVIDVDVKHLFKFVDFVLSQDVFALVPLPPFDASIKDGYAIIAEDGPGPRDVLPSPSVAGSNQVAQIHSGFCSRISTGAAVPKGANAVIQVEDTTLILKNADNEEQRIYLNSQPFVGQDIRPIGSDIPVDKENPLVAKYKSLTPIDLGLIASTGVQRISVFKPPLVAILSTGDEIIDFGQPRPPFCIWDSNRMVLMSLLFKSRVESRDFGIAPDSFEDLFKAIHDCLTTADVLITTGGVSMGERDLLKQILVEDFKATIHFGRVNVKPGKPTTFATLMFENKKKFIFSLPGNPVSAFVTYKLFVEPSLSLLSGNYFQFVGKEITPFTFHKHIKCMVILEEPYKMDPRVEFVRAVIEFPTNQNVQSTVDLLPTARLTESNQISSRLLNVKNANGLLFLDPQKSTEKILNNGEIIDAILF